MNKTNQITIGFEVFDQPKKEKNTNEEKQHFFTKIQFQYKSLICL